jgi:hypothetical protein
MFHLGGNDVNIRPPTCEEHPFESVIISFTPAAREYDLICFTAEQPSNLHSSFIHRLPRRAASPVAARRITVGLIEHHPHRVDDFRRSGSAGIKNQVKYVDTFQAWELHLSARTLRNPAAVIPSAPKQILLPGRSVRQDRWEDGTRFNEPNEVARVEEQINVIAHLKRNVTADNVRARLPDRLMRLHVGDCAHLILRGRQRAGNDQLLFS